MRAHARGCHSIGRGRTLQSLNVAGLYPAGEGAGYAGGIMSAGVDGIEVAEALAADLLGVAAPQAQRAARAAAAAQDTSSLQR